MKTYVQLFWNLLLAVFVISLLWFAYEVWGLNDKVRTLSKRPDITVGTDKKLRKTVDDLEASLKERAEFVFQSRVDPLELSRVVISKNIMLDDKNFLAVIENKPRLSCVINGPTPMAIIRLKSRNHVVETGDVFEGYKVMDVNQEGVRLKRRGRTFALQVEAASKDLAKRLSEIDF